nr:Chain B, Lac23ys_KK, a basic mutant of LacI C-terminal tetramerization helix [Escherichia coli]8GOJ_D Chain D, Lac23ys_KK, a basic mutant of LacI C-terminal tetramerization helix [Escherichia coli]
TASPRALADKLKQLAYKVKRLSS